MEITAALVKELRERTGSGMMECKKALTETGGDIEAAVELMRKTGMAKADKKAGRVAAEGAIVAVASADGARAEIVEVNCEPDFLAKDIAMHVAASKPVAVGPQDVSADVIAKEKEIYVAQAADSGKPAEIVEKMVMGRVRKFLSEITLLGQPFVKNPDQTVEQLLKEKGASVSGFVRYEVGEGIEKKVDNFAEEVMAQVRGG